MSKKLPTQQELEALDASILQKLAQAAKPLTRKELLGSTNKVKESRLTNLRANSQVMGVSITKKNEAFILTSDYSDKFSPLQMCKNAILQRVSNGLTPLSPTKAVLAGKWIPLLYARNMVETAINELKKEGLLIEIEKKNCFIGTASIIKHLAEKNQLPLLKPTQKTTLDVAPKAASVTEEMILTAYNKILQPGFLLLKIGVLQRYLNCDLNELHAVLIGMLNSEKIYFEVGEPNLLEAQDLAAKITYENKNYYYIEVR